MKSEKEIRQLLKDLELVTNNPAIPDSVEHRKTLVNFIKYILNLKTKKDKK